MEMRPRLVLVAGISCSGKTTLAQRLTEELEALHLSMDDYYRGFDHLEVEDRKRINFDAPESVEHELLHSHLTALKAGLPVHQPVYDHAGFARLGTRLEHPRNVIVFEGLFSLYWPEIVELADVTVYVDTPVSVCLERRLFRDTVEFNRSRDEALQRYLTQVMPNQDRYVLPTRSHGHLVVPGDEALEHAVVQVKRALFADQFAFA